MRAIEAKAIVTEDRKITMQLPQDVSPGEHWIVLVIEDISTISGNKPTNKPLNLKTFRWDGWPIECTFRREEIYGNEGR